MSSTFSAAVKAVRKRTGPFERRTRRRRISRHEESSDGTPHFSSFKTSNTDTHFPLRAGLPLAGCYRASILTSRHSHVLVDHSPTTQHSSSRHRCSSHYRWSRVENPESHHS